MDLGLQVSLTESFNIVTADMINVGVPILVSDDIDWLPFITRVKPTSHKDIVNKLHLLYSFPKIIHWLQDKSLKIYNLRSKRVWKKYLNI